MPREGEQDTQSHTATMWHSQPTIVVQEGMAKALALCVYVVDVGE